MGYNLIQDFAVVSLYIAARDKKKTEDKILSVKEMLRQKDA